METIYVTNTIMAVRLAQKKLKKSAGRAIITNSSEWVPFWAPVSSSYNTSKPSPHVHYTILHPDPIWNSCD